MEKRDMETRLKEVESRLWRRGFTASGIAFVFELLAEEHAPGSDEHVAYMKARESMLHG